MEEVSIDGMCGVLLSVTKARPARAAFAVEQAWQLNPQVAFRDKSFGGSRLPLRQPPAGLPQVAPARRTRVVHGAQSYPSAAEAIATVVPEGQHDSYRRALARLAASEVIDPLGAAPLPLKEQFGRGLDHADLPDLGAHLRLQSRLRALPELVGPSAIPTSSPRPKPAALSTALVALKVFYVNIGGGEPMLRPDFFDLVVLRRGPPGRGEILRRRDPLPPAGQDPAAAGARLPRHAVRR